MQRSARTLASVDLAWYCQLVTVTDPLAADRPRLPERRVTISQLVAYNLGFFRRAAGIDQRTIGELLGWSGASVSAAERSWESKRTKVFDADEVMQIAAALDVPLAALFLPPEDHGTAVRYVVHWREREDIDFSDLQQYVFPGRGGDSPALDAYRQRLIAAGAGRQQPTGSRPPESLEHFLELDFPVPLKEALRRKVRGEAGPALERARTETEDIVAEARRQADEITGEAAATAMALERDAQEQYRRAMGTLAQQVEELERRVDDLRAFEREYRARLQTWLEGQIRELWEGVHGLDTDQAIDTLRKRAEQSPGQRVSAVLLKEDGSYDVLQFGPADQGGQAQEESRGGEKASTP
jgi:cell division septum initiation protein DivIVA